VRASQCERERQCERVLAGVFAGVREFALAIGSSYKITRQQSEQVRRESKRESWHNARSGGRESEKGSQRGCMHETSEAREQDRVRELEAAAHAEVMRTTRKRESVRAAEGQHLVGVRVRVCPVNVLDRWAERERGQSERGKGSERGEASETREHERVRTRLVCVCVSVCVCVCVCVCVSKWVHLFRVRVVS
jgi:hypothetical protein